MKRSTAFFLSLVTSASLLAAVLVALDRFRKQTDEDPNDFED